jgi:hypothetical protein
MKTKIRKESLITLLMFVSESEHAFMETQLPWTLLLGNRLSICTCCIFLLLPLYLEKVYHSPVNGIRDIENTESKEIRFSAVTSSELKNRLIKLSSK